MGVVNSIIPYVNQIIQFKGLEIFWVRIRFAVKNIDLDALHNTKHFFAFATFSWIKYNNNLS